MREFVAVTPTGNLYRIEILLRGIGSLACRSLLRIL